MHIKKVVLFFDTAETYGKEMFEAGHNERLVGKAVEPFRKDITLATKLYLNTQEVENNGLEKVIREHLKKINEKFKNRLYRSLLFT